jgi:hypothetical protein
MAVRDHEKIVLTENRNSVYVEDKIDFRLKSATNVFNWKIGDPVSQKEAEDFLKNAPSYVKRTVEIVE